MTAFYTEIGVRRDEEEYVAFEWDSDREGRGESIAEALHGLAEEMES